jgi:hypothetical protein
VTIEDFESYLTTIGTDLRDFMDDVFAEKDEDAFRALVYTDAEATTMSLYEDLLLITDLTGYETVKANYSVDIYEIVDVLNANDVSAEGAQSFVEEKLGMTWIEFQEYEDVVDVLDTLFWYQTDAEVSYGSIVAEFEAITDYGDFEALVESYGFTAEEAVDILNH